MHPDFPHSYENSIPTNKTQFQVHQPEILIQVIITIRHQLQLQSQLDVSERCSAFFQKKRCTLKLLLVLESQLSFSWLAFSVSSRFFTIQHLSLAFSPLLLFLQLQDLLNGTDHNNTWTNFLKRSTFLRQWPCLDPCSSLSGSVSSTHQESSVLYSLLLNSTLFFFSSATHSHSERVQSDKQNLKLHLQSSKIKLVAFSEQR